MQVYILSSRTSTEISGVFASAEAAQKWMFDNLGDKCYHAGGYGPGLQFWKCGDTEYEIRVWPVSK